MIKFSKLCFESLHGDTPDVVVFKCKIFPTGDQRNRALFTSHKTKFQIPFKLSLLRGSRPKSARSSPQHLAHTVPNFIQFDSLSAEL